MEALALELDLLNWVLGEGPGFSRRAFWREALPRGVAMLRACGEEAELSSLCTAAWRPTLEREGAPPVPPAALLYQLRRARDRVNLRLMRRPVPLASSSNGNPGGGSTAAAGSGYDTPTDAARGANPRRRVDEWLNSLHAELPLLPLSVCGRVLAEDAVEAVAKALAESAAGTTVALYAPEGRPLRVLNDTAGFLTLQLEHGAQGAAPAGSSAQRTALPPMSLAPGESATLLEAAAAEPSCEVRLGVRREGVASAVDFPVWVSSVLLRFDACDAISQYGHACEPEGGVAAAAWDEPQQPMEEQPPQLASWADEGLAAEGAEGGGGDGGAGSEARRRAAGRRLGASRVTAVQCSSPTLRALLLQSGSPTPLLSPARSPMGPAGRSPLACHHGQPPPDSQPAVHPAAASPHRARRGAPAKAPAAPPVAEAAAEAAAAAVAVARAAFEAALEALCEPAGGAEHGTVLPRLRAAADEFSRAALEQSTLCEEWRAAAEGATALLLRLPPPRRQQAERDALLADITAHLTGTTSHEAGGLAAAASLEARGARMLAEVAEAAATAEPLQRARELRKLGAPALSALIDALAAAAASSHEMAPGKLLLRAAARRLAAHKLKVGAMPSPPPSRQPSPPPLEAHPSLDLVLGAEQVASPAEASEEAKPGLPPSPDEPPPALPTVAPPVDTDGTVAPPAAEKKKKRPSVPPPPAATRASAVSWAAAAAELDAAAPAAAGPAPAPAAEAPAAAAPSDAAQAEGFCELDDSIEELRRTLALERERLQARRTARTTTPRPTARHTLQGHELSMLSSRGGRAAPASPSSRPAPNSDPPATPAHAPALRAFETPLEDGPRPEAAGVTTAGAGGGAVDQPETSVEAPSMSAQQQPPSSFGTSARALRELRSAPNRPATGADGAGGKRGSKGERWLRGKGVRGHGASFARGMPRTPVAGGSRNAAAQGTPGMVFGVD